MGLNRTCVASIAQAAGAAIIKRWRLGSLGPHFHAWRAYAHERKRRKGEVVLRTVNRLALSEIWRYGALVVRRPSVCRLALCMA